MISSGISSGILFSSATSAAEKKLSAKALSLKGK
jgi:hypothetical protein